MFLQRVLRNFKVKYGRDFSFPSSPLRLLGVIIAPALFLAISGRAPNRISWHFLVLTLPLLMLSLLIGFLRFNGKPAKNLSISQPDVAN
jgi:hypothetical protein